jgi:hypothetical protein
MNMNNFPNCWKLLSSEDHNKGQKVDDGHFGIIRIPCPLHNAKWEIALQISLTGGTIQQLWPNAIEIFNLCIRKNISIEVEWIPREQNQTADAYSKVFNYDDWSISDKCNPMPST